MNQMKAYLVLVIISVLLLLFGHLLMPTGYAGLFVAIIWVLFLVPVAIFLSNKLIPSIYAPTKATEAAYPAIFKALKALCAKANVPMPELYVLETVAVNGLSYGRTPQESAIMLTTGLIERLDETALKGVLCYLLVQIKSRQSFLSLISISVAHGVYNLFSARSWKNFFNLDSGKNTDEETASTFGGFIATPVAAFLLKLMVHKKRVYDIDLAAKQLCEDTTPLLKALEILSKEYPKHIFLQANLFPTSAALFIVNPLKDSRLRSSFDLFPTEEERIEHLSDKTKASAIA